MSAPEYPPPNAVGKPLPAWRLPTITVEDHTTPHGVIVSVTQRVPARVAEVEARQEITTMGRKKIRVTESYESGLGAASRIPLVPERLTVLAPDGDAQAIHDAVERARRAFKPRGHARSRSIPRPALVALGKSVLFFISGAAIIPATMSGRGPFGAPGTDLSDSPVMAVILLGFFALACVVMAVATSRRAWALRTPPWAAEGQWLLLRQALTRATGAAPGTSRPREIDAGMRCDLLLYPPSGAPRSSTPSDGIVSAEAPGADGIVGPPRIRDRMKILALLLAVLSVPLALVLSPVLEGLDGSAISGSAPLASLAIGIVFLFLRKADPVIAAFPRTVVSPSGAWRVRMEELDLADLHGWCEARHREDLWRAPERAFFVGFAAGLIYALCGRSLGLATLPPSSGDLVPTAAEVARANHISVAVMAAAIALTMLVGLLITRARHRSRRAHAEELWGRALSLHGEG